MSVFNDPSLYQVVGSITAANGVVNLTTPQASAGAFIGVSGTFSGDLTFQGSNDNSTFNNHRAYKTGVGPLGTATVTYSNAQATSSEYRIVTGDKYLRVLAGSNFSGTANITITSTPYPVLNFINGPVHNAREEALRAAKKYNFSSSNQTAPSGGSMGMYIANPSTSLVNISIYRVVLSNNSGNVLSYQVYRNPTNTGTGFTALNGSNAKIGSTVTTAATSGYILSTSTTPFSGGTNGSSGFIPANGIEKDLENDVFLTPGQILGYIIVGAQGALAAATPMNCTIYYYEEVAY